VFSNTNPDLFFAPNGGTATVTFQQDGDVGIGTINPDAPLHILKAAGGANIVTALKLDPDDATTGSGVSIDFNASTTNTGASLVGSRIVGARQGGNASGFLALYTSPDTSGSVPLERMRIDSSGNVGIGTTSPQGKLHVKSANAGSFTYNTNADDLIVESNTNGGITIATAAANTSKIIFASPDDATGSEILFNQASTLMKLGTTTASGILALQSGNGSEAMRINAAGTVLINASAPRISASKLSVQGGMSEFETTLTNNSDWQNSPVSILERANIGLSSADNKYSPNLNFHWSGRVSNSLWMGANGNLNYGTYTSSGGVPAVDGTFAAGNLIAASAITGNTGTFTGLVSGITPVNAANFVTKAYVDGSGGGTGPFLPLAGGTMTGTNGVVLPDNFILNVGTGNDLTIKHNATNSFIENNTGDLSIVNYANDKDIILWGDDGTGGISKYLVLEGVSTNAYFSNPGNVGIGTTSPDSKLSVQC
jgi:hypothetical protein